MSTGEGLTRRRGAGPAPAGGDPPNPDSSSSSPSTSTPRRPGAGIPTSSAGYESGNGAMEGRGKVVYDPRDFEDKGESQQMPRLTLMEEILLLGLKDKAVSISSASSHLSNHLDLRATSLSGMTISPTLYEVPF